MAKKLKENPSPQKDVLEPLLDGLNQQQSKAVKSMVDFLYRQKPEIFLLKGFAGTGKTFSISRLAQYVLSVGKKDFKRGGSIAFTAPTNKAVQVLRESSGKDISKYVTFATIHQLLGLKEVILDNGEIVFRNSFDGGNDINLYDVLVIDEVSMLNDELFYLIKNHINQVKILMMGDPAQIPPVGKDDCEPFLNPQSHNIIVEELTEIMRQKQDSGIVRLSMEIRDSIFRPYHFHGCNEKDLSVICSTTERNSAVNQLKHIYSNISIEGFDNNTKVVAWRNRKVDEYNNYIRSLLTGTTQNPQIINGERMIANSPISEGESIIMTTNTEFKVVSFSDSVIEHVFDKQTNNFDVYKAKVLFYDPQLEKDVEETIFVLKKESKAKYDSLLNRIKNSALHAPLNKKKYFWKEFYRFSRKFADVSYAYAITAHKSQGSTYGITIVDAKDISANQNIRERNRILYTAITRSKNKTIVIY